MTSGAASGAALEHDGETTAAILIIGAEILSGKVQDANGPFLIRSLRARGVELRELRVIGDGVATIASAVRALAPQVDHLLTSGGIGPTHDDLTVAGVAAGLGVAVAPHPELRRLLLERFPDAARRPAALKMTETPVGARIALAEGGFVPVIQAANVTILPGVPSLLRLCFARVAEQFGGAAFHGRALLLNTSETRIAADLAAVQDAHPNVAIGSYPRFDEAPYRVKITVDGRSRSAVDAAIDALRLCLDPQVIVGEE